ncbi:hypothetical protein V1515DRAFT_601926 [Lipomyces mesembrius]
MHFAQDCEMTWKVRAFARAGDRPTPKAVYNFRVYYTSLVIAIAGTTIGYDNGFVGATIVLPSFKAQFELDKLSSSQFNVVSPISSPLSKSAASLDPDESLRRGKCQDEPPEYHVLKVPYPSATSEPSVSSVGAPSARVRGFNFYL